MPKIDMTPEIGQKIKEWRLRFNVKSKDLAEHISKSPAYISKLEKGDIKQIEKSLLECIVVFISDDQDGYEKFIDKATEEISAEELDKYTWFLNFDTIERKIPVPETLVAFIESKMSTLNIDSNILCDYINENEDLDDEFFEKHNIVKANIHPNIWNAYKTISSEGKQITSSFILLNCRPQKLDKILSRELDRCNHTFLFVVVYHILKFECKNVNNTIDVESLKSETRQILRSHKFYSLSDRNKFAEQANTKKEFEELLSDFDRKNQDLINDLLEAISILSDYNVKYANDKLSKIVQNTKQDSSFAFSFMAISLEPLDKISVVLKREFLEKISELIQSYKEKPESEKNIEKY